MNEIFTLRHQNQYNLRNWTYFDAPKVRTVSHGSESVRYLSSKIWEIIPVYTKELDTTDKFKIAIKKWKPESCPCRLCRLSTKYGLLINLNRDLLLCLHIFYKIVDKGLLQICQIEIFWKCS